MGFDVRIAFCKF